MPVSFSGQKLLAADLRALGCKDVQPAANGVVKNGVLEVWIVAGQARAAP